MQSLKKTVFTASLLSASLSIHSLFAMWCVESWNDVSISGDGELTE